MLFGRSSRNDWTRINQACWQLCWLDLELLGRAGQLLFTVGGQSEARARVTPILEGMGRGVVDIGDAAEQAAIIKITGPLLGFPLNCTR